MKKRKILFIDSFRDPQKIFLDDYYAGSKVAVCRTVPEAWKAIRKGQKYDVWSVSHDMPVTIQKDGGGISGGHHFLLWAHQKRDIVHWPAAISVHSGSVWDWGDREMLTFIGWLRTSLTSPPSNT